MKKEKGCHFLWNTVRWWLQFPHLLCLCQHV